VTEGRQGKDGSPALSYRQRGTRLDRQLGIGPLDIVTLIAARNAAKQCREQPLAGLDPIEQRNAERVSRAAAEA
jgi:hypothetical protein